MFKVPWIHLNYFLSLSVHPGITILFVEPFQKSLNTHTAGPNPTANGCKSRKLPLVGHIWHVLKSSNFSFCNSGTSTVELKGDRGEMYGKRPKATVTIRVDLYSSCHVEIPDNFIRVWSQVRAEMGHARCCFVNKDFFFWLPVSDIVTAFGSRRWGFGCRDLIIHRTETSVLFKSDQSLVKHIWMNKELSEILRSCIHSHPIGIDFVKKRRRLAKQRKSDQTYKVPL